MNKIYKLFYQFSEFMNAVGCTRDEFFANESAREGANEGANEGYNPDILTPERDERMIVLFLMKALEVLANEHPNMQIQGNRDIANILEGNIREYYTAIIRPMLDLFVAQGDDGIKLGIPYSQELQDALDNASCLSNGMTPS